MGRRRYCRRCRRKMKETDFPFFSSPWFSLSTFSFDIAATLPLLLCAFPLCSVLFDPFPRFPVFRVFPSCPFGRGDEHDGCMTAANATCKLEVTDRAAIFQFICCSVAFEPMVVAVSMRVCGCLVYCMLIGMYVLFALSICAV